MVWKDAKGNIVEPERWVWGVLYRNGTELHQFDETGRFHPFSDIQQMSVAQFTLYPRGQGNAVHFLIPKGAELIHRYRNVVLEMGRPNEVRARVYVFGYCLEAKYCLAYVMPDDVVIFSEDSDLSVAPFFSRPIGSV